MEQDAACTIKLPEQPMDCDCCGVAPLVASGLVNGDVFVHRYSSGEGDDGGGGSGDGAGSDDDSDAGGAGSALAAAQRAQRGASSSGRLGGSITASRALHRRGKGGASCRAVRFAGDGSGLVCGYESGSIQVLDLETGKLSARFAKAHDAGITRLLSLDGRRSGGAGSSGDGEAAAAAQLLAAGDEDGGLKIWDLRRPAGAGAVMTYGKHTDFITGLTQRHDNGFLVASSGDGTLSVHDLRGRKAVARSEADADDEMLSVVVLKHGKKVVAGCQSGVLSIFSWGYWNDCSDRFPGHPESVDALVAFDEETIITGSSDGALRVLSVQPNKLLGVVGEYKEGTPVERLALGWDHRVAASASHEAAVRLWDLSCLHDDSGGEEEEEEEADEEGEGKSDEDGGEGERAAAASEAAGGGGGAEEGEGGSGNGSDSSDSGDGSDGGSGSDSDSDEGGKRKRKRRERTRMTKGNNRPKTGGNFFADLL